VPKNFQLLSLNDVHRHWSYCPQTPPIVTPVVLDPAIVQPRGRPTTKPTIPKRRLNRAATARQAASSTRQNPSAFEQAALPTRRRAVAHKAAEISTGTEISRTCSSKNY